MSHIAVERNRRKLMNQHLKVLRSLTPSFYIKRGDQASIIGGVIEFIKELHQIKQALESKKTRTKSLSLSPPSAPTTPSPRPLSLQLSSTPSPFPPPSHDHEQQHHHESSSPNLVLENSTNFNCAGNKLELGVASCNSSVADVEAKISGPNVILRTISRRIPGQVVKLIDVLEKFSFEILHLNISSMEDTVLCSFVIKIGLECQLSVEELTHEVQKSFS